jgi:2-amino-4-hydroxy-6-hydroxymethyldihydropteridine diphosphokinase / dihydropteroate synthase
MSIINLTPDSFSDGGENTATDLDTLKAKVQDHIAAGATILDLGGQSTRPGATLLPAAGELERVLPALRFIKSLPEASKCAISIDTFYASVAAAAVEAGADIVNDISGGTMDPEMFSTVAKLGKTICIMHMRGTPTTMNSLATYPNGVVEAVTEELLSRVRAAEAAGIRRWRIILDPGLGFAKTGTQNIELLRHLSRLRETEGLKGLPWLVGPSRKGFVGKITGVSDAKERTWGTAAAVTAAIQGGADIVRVHDVVEMAKVVKMADAVWRF